MSRFLQIVKSRFRDTLVTLVALFVGWEPRIHRIPFGPIKGKRICITFAVSPRMYLGIHEPWVARLAHDLIQPDDIVYDIGAHVGYTSLLFASLASTGIVYAFEILPSTVGSFLRKTVESNDVHNIVIHNVGLAASARMIELPIGPTMMTSLVSPPGMQKGATDLCRVVSLDDYVIENKLRLPSLIKIDVEGAEVDCLLGGLKLIRKCLPKMIVEFHSADLLRKGYSILAPLGYTLITPKRTRVDDQMLSNMEQSYEENVLCLPRQSGIGGPVQ